MVGMPDVSVVVPMFDMTHPHHEISRAWCRQAAVTGWALCPLMISGFLRISSRPDQTGMRSLSELAEGLKGLIQQHQPTYYYWYDEISLIDERRFDLSKIQGYRQLSDLHLLGITHQNSGTLVTIDTGFRQTLNAVRCSTPHLLKIFGEQN